MFGNQTKRVSKILSQFTKISDKLQIAVNDIDTTKDDLI